MEKWEYSNADIIETEEVAFDFKKAFDQILDHWAYIAISLMIALILAFLVNRYSARVYEVSTTILIKAPKESNSISELLYGQEMFGRSSIILEDEAQLFKSGTLIEKTLRELDMDVSYHFDSNVGNVELYKIAPIHMFISETASNVPYGIVFECTILDEKRFQLQYQALPMKKRLTNLIKREPERVDNFKDKVYQFGQEINVDGFRFRIEYSPSLNLPEFNNSILVKISRYSDLTKNYMGKVKAAPHSAESYIMNLSMEIGNTEKGTDFLEELVANFIESELLLKNTIATNTIEFINSQILLMSDSLNIVEDQLETFKKSNSNLTLSDQGNNYLQVGQEFESQRNQVQLKNRYLSDLESNIANDNVSDIYIPSSVGIDDPNLNKNIQELVDLQMQLKSIDPNKSSSNPIVRNYQQRIDILKRGVGENIRSIKSSNSIALNNINSQLGKVNATLRTLPTAERQFINIQRNYNLNEGLYLFLMQKKAEAGIAKASNTVDYRIVNDADTKGKGPIKPSPMLNYIMALFLGGAIPISLIFLKNALNNRIGSKEHLFSLSVIPYLGMVARSSNKIKLIDDQNVRSEVSETFRTVRSNLRYMLGDDDEGKIFLLTSFVSGEGKTFCANNLAYIFSNFGKRVLLLNADMRKPNDYEAFGVIDDMGLSDYLAGIATKAQIIRESKFQNLHIISSGGIPPNPSELLIGGQIKSLLDELKAEYDYVILDTPPVGILADGLELMGMSDVSILVVRQNYTDKRALKEFNEIYQKSKVKNLAILFNAVNLKKTAYGYGYGGYGSGYGYGYNNYNKPKKTGITAIFN